MANGYPSAHGKISFRITVNASLTWWAEVLVFLLSLMLSVVRQLCNGTVWIIEKYGISAKAQVE
jgi:hypothetical protein